MIRNIFYVILVSVTVGCGSAKQYVFTEGNWTTNQRTGTVRNLSTGLTFNLSGLERRYWELPDSARLITSNTHLTENQNFADYAKSVFSDLNITNKDSLLFFIPGELLVFLPSDYNVSNADYCFYPVNEQENKYGRQPHQSDRSINDSFVFRKLVFNKKRKRIINTDTFKDNQNRWLSMAYLNETRTKFNSKITPRVWTAMFIDLSAPQSMLSASDFINECDKITFNNRLNISLSGKYAFSLFENYFKLGRFYNYQAARLGEKQTENYYKQSERGIFWQALATYYSFVNDTQKSDSLWLLMRKGAINNKAIEKIATANELLKITENQQVVMFNEAHNAPKHRLFVTSLLDSLYAQGFRYFALEAFTNDSLFANTGYLTEDNGFYIFEPHLANLIRNAYHKGFKIIGYEDYSKDREQRQAENIYNQTLKNDKDAKVMVYCGYQHIDTAWMAGKFQKISGIDPLTIDQTYSYYYCLGKPATDSAYLIIPNAEDKFINSADLFVFNDLDIHKGSRIFEIDRSIPQDCKTVYFFAKKEFDYLTEIGKNPIPYAVRNIENCNFIKHNIQSGEYELLFVDNYGQVLKSMTVSFD
ncbi:MAG: hypothetical protein LBS50_10915 [Prevotellaceae bacterium]|nr:hypothetical protein [Prevotellaceae bacterium]